MLYNFRWELGKILFPELEEYQQAQDLALQAERIVRNLSSLPSFDSQEQSNLISVLKSVNLLLERLVERSEVDTLNSKSIHTNQGGENKNDKYLVRDVSDVGKDVFQEESLEVEEEKEQVKREEETNILTVISSEAVLSTAAKELIKIRDWILLAFNENNTPTPKILNVLYKQLGQILEKEGVISLEEIGKFDYERQQIISTRVTDDPEKNEMVCETVRPGYLFNGSVVRPQEVIIYIFE
jgi:molecular chaperone GrpE (heat shock protein)